MMSEIQDKLAELISKGWTLASIARELGLSHRTVESWKEGARKRPANEKLVMEALDRLLKKERIPKKKLYQKGSRIKQSE